MTRAVTVFGVLCFLVLTGLGAWVGELDPLVALGLDVFVVWFAIFGEPKYERSRK